ncbi:MAG: response regulator [Bacteroidales bacterium]|jgi:CheY-like chemotaxis protein|nr:response regulator [Bacteroidales bacterium]
MKVFEGQKILVVEDNFMSFKLIEAYLRKSNVDLLHAKDGKQALTLFKSNPTIKLILMDIQLPGMSGLDATKFIRESNTDIPIIAATANVFEDDKIACFDAGCTDYITKPINFVVLFDLLEKYLN